MKPDLCVLVVLMLAFAAWAVLSTPPTLAAPRLLPFNVTSTRDAIDDAPGDGFCHTSVVGPAAGAVVNVPAGIYTLTISAIPAAGETNGDLI